jgi:hypothetical protein
MVVSVRRCGVRHARVDRRVAAAAGDREASIVSKSWLLSRHVRRGRIACGALQIEEG